MIRYRFLIFTAMLAIWCTYSAAEPVGQVVTVNQPGDKYETPKIAVAANGNFVVTWTEYGSSLDASPASLDGDGRGIFARIFDQNGQPITDEFQVNQYATGDQTGPDIAVDPLGNFVITWTSFYPDTSIVGHPDIYARQYTAAGLPVDNEFLVSTNMPYGAAGSAISMDSSGNFIIVWAAYDTSYGAYGIYGKQYNSAASPLGNEFLVNTTTDLDQSYPAVSMNDSGAFVVVWQDGYYLAKDYDGADTSGWGIFGQLFDSTGVRNGAEFQVNTSFSGNQKYPHVTMTSSGSFAVIWSDYEKIAPLVGLYGKVFGPTVTDVVKDEFLIASDVMPDPWYGPSIATLSDASFISVYAKSENKIYGRRYSSAGAPLETEFEISYPTYGGLSPSVATDNNQNFVVAWINSLQGPVDISAQIFDSGPVTKQDYPRNTVPQEAGGGSALIIDIILIMFGIGTTLANRQTGSRYSGSK